MTPVTMPRQTVPSPLVRHGWQLWRRVLGVVTALAVVLSLAAVTSQVAAADTAGTPPNIIDYTRVLPADWGALQRFEAQAARDVLTNHGLPDDDYDAVRGWARNQVRTQMWANLVVIIKKTTRTTDEQAVYRWFQALVQKQNVAAARATVDEFIRYSGLTESTYTTSEPVNYNNPDKSLASGGYCTYRAPGPYLDDYHGWLDQTCYTAGTGLANFAIPMPSYDEFIAYGQYLANKDEVANASFANTSFEVAASLAMGASVALAVTASVLPITLALGAGATLGTSAAAAASAVFPFAARAGSLALVATGALAAVVGTVIVFVVSVVLASIQVEAQLNMGRKLKKNLDDLTATPPDLREQILDDEERAADASLSEDEQKPKYYGGFFTTFLQGTLPEADAEPCSSELVISGGIYAPGCVNSPTPAPVVVDDPIFTVVREGDFAGTQRRSVTVHDPYNGGTAVTRASGKGWFVHTAVQSGRVSQSLVMPYRNWQGESYFAERIWDATNGYRFSITPVGDGAEATDAVVTDKLEVTLSDNSRVTLRLVPSPVSSVGVTLPGRVVLNEPATFSAAATGTGAPGVQYIWWFPRLPTEPENLGGERPAVVPTSYNRVDGATVQRTITQAGPLPVFLEVRSPDGTQQVTRYDITVIDGRQPDRLTVVPPEGLRVGQSTFLDARAASGADVTIQPVEPLGACGVASRFPVPTLKVNALKAGTCTMRVSTGSSSLTVQPTELTVSFRIFKGEQAITAPALGDLVAGETQTVTATASSTLPVAVAVAPIATEVCAVTGTTVSATAAGTCKLLLTQAGDNNFLPAPPVLVEFSVEAPVTVTARDETIVYGGTPAYEFDVSDPAAEVTGVECAAEPPLTVGTHPITCSGGSLTGDGTLAYAAGTLTVTPASAVVTVTPPATQYSDPVPNLDASWSVNGLFGEDELAGTLSGCTATGLSVTGGAVWSPAGSFALTGCGGLTNPNYDVSYTGSLAVDRESATVTFDGEWYVSTGTAASASVPLRATVTQAADGSPGDLTKARVDFLVFKADTTGTTPDYSATGVAVGAGGTASTTIAALPAGLYRVVVRMPTANGYFTGTSTPDALVVYSPMPGSSVSGGGWVPDAGSRDGKGHFGLSARYSKTNQPQGQASYAWRSRENGYDYVVRSTSWSGGTLAIRRGGAAVVAKATLAVLDPATGLLVPSLSGGNHTIAVDVVDGGKSGSGDTYAVVVRTPSGATLHSVAPTLVSGGNITVQP